MSEPSRITILLCAVRVKRYIELHNNCSFEEAFKHIDDHELDRIPNVETYDYLVKNFWPFKKESEQEFRENTLMDVLFEEVKKKVKEIEERRIVESQPAHILLKEGKKRRES